MCQVGQALYGKVKFKDGKKPFYPRYYLVVKTEKDFIGILNVSSVQGKARKILYETNYLLQKFHPPFLVETFVKLDSYVEISKEQAKLLEIKCDGQLLDADDLNKILEEYQKYNK